jgi:hypothetical protein
MCTSTTQEQYYEPGSRRCGNPIVKIKSGQFGFDEDCILDFKIGMVHDEITSAILEKYKADIMRVSNILEIDCNFMRMIYNKILKSGYPPKIILDIHESFNCAGITGLQKPKMRS